RTDLDPLPAAEVNLINTLLGTIADLAPQATITVGAEAANVIQVSVQFKDAGGNNLAQRMGALCWLADAANAAETAAAPSGGWAAGVGYKLADEITNKRGRFQSDATGLLRVDITEAAAKTFYLHVAVGARVFVSGAITFA
ncbi:MAG TPA: hypothetical protein VFU47_12700, partial [Armatimonadota bacterium]|nr:hypothetical protein [Armatimonadota bacterium]